MQNDKLIFKKLTQENIQEISLLGQQLNPKLTLEEVKAYQKEMFTFPNYHCFGLFMEDSLVGISSGWITVRLYSGKQLEVDNVIIDSNIQSKGLGKIFFEHINAWAKENQCKTIELNTYVQNARSHKFYFNNGFSILGFHFWKRL
ncbi:GNAT family N-acetyltransferase [Galbibacter mesophilus]|uniref:GNAT family N-acetyltransferase n=1 Tax=Galbibacter mesophilus TaxID=379069 RepID=UPI00191E85A8|nr:GNAT family N-acetyltransferase [Galbibacter mesophilus]MCM5662178.1 GNAT family N-acetyltransferase [Galbibacter mesophilus]